MLTTKLNNLNLNIDELRAEHESALNKIKEIEEKESKRQEWFSKRLGKFSSSCIFKLMTYEDKIDILPKGAETYIFEKVIEIETAGKGVKTYSNDSMIRGNEIELQAIGRFEKEKGYACYATGDDQKFIELNSYFGGTPDGLIEDWGLIEVKCPDSKTHLFYILNIKNVTDLKKHCPNYYWQIQANLLATGRNKAYFISYDDRFENEKKQILILEIVRNEQDIENLKIRLKMAEKRKQELLKG